MDILTQIGPFAKLSLLVSVIPLGTAVAYLMRPSERRLVLMRPVSLGAIYAAICSLAAGVGMMCRYLSDAPAGSIDLPRMFAGLGEAVVPLFVACGFLSVAWLLVAVGMLRRRD